MWARLSEHSPIAELPNSRRIDPLLAQHFAHLFIRDPLVLFCEKIHADDDENEAYHFECIQSTNWQTLRFKPPPPNTNIGWRVEFRPMDLTDFENAAYVVFVVLLTRVILSYGLNFLVPLSKVDAPPADDTESEDEVGILMSIDTIINGKVGNPAGQGSRPSSQCQALRALAASRSPFVIHRHDGPEHQNNRLLYVSLPPFCAVAEWSACCG
ncbi:unnamed protein product [Lampetra fluviatilis]